MKYYITVLFALCLLAVCLLSLNYLWGWFPVNYGDVAKVALSLLILLLAVTGFAMIYKGGFSKNSDHKIVGKK